MVILPSCKKIVLQSLLTMKKLEKICNDIFTRLYQESEPPLDWNNLPEDFDFMNHYLDKARMDEIVKSELSKHKLSDRYLTSINFEVYLGPSPMCVKK